jgi:hypothetical protein
MNKVCYASSQYNTVIQMLSSLLGKSHFIIFILQQQYQQKNELFLSLSFYTLFLIIFNMTLMKILFIHFKLYKRKIYILCNKGHLLINKHFKLTFNENGKCFLVFYELHRHSL